MKQLMRGIVATIAAVTTLMWAGTVQGAFPGDNGKIIGTGGRGIVVMDADGSNLHRLRNSKDTDGVPSYSPSGKRIVFGCKDSGATLDGEICVMRADGTHRRVITDERGRGKDPEWSPDHTRVVFTGGNRKRRGVFTIRLDGTGLRMIEEHALYPTWSSRDRIAYATGGLYSSARDGSDERLLAGGNGRCRFNSPDWAPGGRRLVFARSCGDHGANELLIIRSDGSHQHRLGVEGFYPAWSPDGSRILFHSGDHLYSIHPDGTGKERITDRAMFSADWQPLPD